MPKYTLNINKTSYDVEVAAGTSLLWVLREDLGLTGAKYGCGIGQCGACTVHVDKQPIKACLLPIEQFTAGQEITPIEGLSEHGDHPVQKAWIEAQAPQCGYCHSGQIMQAVALLEQKEHPTHDEIKAHMNGNLCRCGTYLRILTAIEMAAKTKNTTS